MDFSLDSSVVLAAAVGLWLVWVGPYLLRRPGTAAVEATAADVAIPLPTPARSCGSQGSVMEFSAHAGTSAARPTDARRTGAGLVVAGQAPEGLGNGQLRPDTPVPGAGSRPTRSRVRYGRLAIALAAAAAVPLAAVLGVLGGLGQVHASAAPAALGIGSLAVIMLRFTTVRERRRRADRAFEKALAPALPPAADGKTGVRNAGSGKTAVVRDDAGAASGGGAGRHATATGASTTGQAVVREGQVADATAQPAKAAPAGNAGGEHSTGPARPAGAGMLADPGNTAAAGGRARLSPADLRAAALAVAAEAGDTPAPATGGAPWQPVALPRPTYVESARAPRAEPAPLALPEAPRAATRTPIKHSAAAAETADSAQSGSAQQAAGAGMATGPAGTARLNLDAVLQRRRA